MEGEIARNRTVEIRSNSSLVESALSNAFCNDEYADAWLILDKIMLPVHRLVVCSSSKYLKRLLDGRNPVIYLPYELDTVLNIIEYMYKGYVEVQEKLLPRFLQVASELEIKIIDQASSKPMDKESKEKEEMVEGVKQITNHLQGVGSNLTLISNCNNKIVDDLENSLLRKISENDISSQKDESWKNDLKDLVSILKAKSCDTGPDSKETSNEVTISCDNIKLNSVKDDSSITLLEKLEKYGTVVSGGKTAGVLDIPAWWLSNENISVSIKHKQCREGDSKVTSISEDDDLVYLGKYKSPPPPVKRSFPQLKKCDNKKQRTGQTDLPASLNCYNQTVDRSYVKRQNVVIVDHTFPPVHQTTPINETGMNRPYSMNWCKGQNTKASASMPSNQQPLFTVMPYTQTSRYIQSVSYPSFQYHETPADNSSLMSAQPHINLTDQRNAVFEPHLNFQMVKNLASTSDLNKIPQNLTNDVSKNPQIVTEYNSASDVSKNPQIVTKYNSISDVSKHFQPVTILYSASDISKNSQIVQYYNSDSDSDVSKDSQFVTNYDSTDVCKSSQSTVDYNSSSAVYSNLDIVNSMHKEHATSVSRVSDTIKTDFHYADSQTSVSLGNQLSINVTDKNLDINGDNVIEFPPKILKVSTEFDKNYEMHEENYEKKQNITSREEEIAEHNSEDELTELGTVKKEEEIAEHNSEDDLTELGTVKKEEEIAEHNSEDELPELGTVKDHKKLNFSKGFLGDNTTPLLNLGKPLVEQVILREQMQESFVEQVIPQEQMQEPLVEQVIPQEQMQEPLIEQVIPREQMREPLIEQVIPREQMREPLIEQVIPREQMRAREQMREPLIEQVIPREQMRPKREASKMVAIKIAAALKSNYYAATPKSKWTKKKKGHTHNKKIPEVIPTPKYSDYEKAAHARLALRNEFLKSLNIFSAPDED